MQENCTFSIIPYGITMSKIFSFLFIVPNDSTMSSFLPHPCRANYYCLFLFLGLVSVISRSSVGGTLGTLSRTQLF